jgi:hypothetical protein
MSKTALGVAALVAVVCATGPANAAKVRAGDCSGPSQARVQALVDGLADSPNRIMAQEEIAMAQTDMLNGRLASCAVHLARAANDATMRGIPSGAMRPILPPAPTGQVKPAI